MAMLSSSLYWQLFKSTFLISAFTVGGGYVIVPLLKDKFVDTYHWLTNSEALEMVSIAQAAPGVIAVNASLILGHKIAGLKGALVALVGTVLPPLITISIIAWCYASFATNHIVRLILAGMQCAATALILSVMVDWVRKALGKGLPLLTLLILVVFVANYVFHVSMLYMLLLAAIVGLVGMQDKKYD